jgi:DNA-binding response OmpR family regulator
MNIVIIEDDALIAYQIESCVQNLGHTVLGSFDEAKTAIDFISSSKPDFVFMDIQLNGSIDGIQCAALLKHKHNVPSLFVTSHDEAEVIEEATLLEPLNFLPKPFTDKNIEASLALAKIALKKAPIIKISDVSSASLGEYTFNFEYNTLKHKDYLVKLSPNETKLLMLLFKNIGNIVSHEEISNYIWMDKPTSSSSFRKHISRTNGKLIGVQIISDKGSGYYLKQIN